MSEILGHDCDRRPLYSGDRVIYVGGPNTNPWRVGTRGRLINLETSNHILARARALGHTGSVIRYETDCGDLLAGDDNKFRKLDPPSDWHEVERITGWRPQPETEEA